MSSGACRALVAVLLTLVATIVTAVPVVAQNDQLETESNAVYRVHPDTGTIEVSILMTMEANQQQKALNWRQLVVEEETTPRARAPFQVTNRSRGLPGLYKAVDIKTPQLGAREPAKFNVVYDIDANVDQDSITKSLVPARIDGSYLYFCVTGQETTSGSVRVQIDDPDEWKPTQLGTQMDATSSGFESTDADARAPEDIYTCFEGVRSSRLAKKTLVGPAGRTIELQAWEDIPNWIAAAERLVPGALQTLHRFLRYDIPGEGPVIVRMAPSPEIGGWAGAHSTPGIVQLDEGPSGDIEHQLAHAWFGTDNFIEIWLREGMADWTSSSIRGETCAPVTVNRDELDLSNDGWMVIQPRLSEEEELVIGVQDDAACGIVSAIASRMPSERWNEVIGSMLRGETKYVGSAGPEIGTSRFVDWREWLDAVDERGLVPAASDPDHADNLGNLDFAQNLLEAFEITQPIGDELAQRSEARAAYHAFLDEIAPLGAPNAVRKDMDDWDFAMAMSRMEKSREVYRKLTEADDNLPEADLVRIMKPQFEAARNETELDEVAELVDTILRETRAIIGPLGSLQDELEPLGWTQPSAIIDAIGQRRFEDARAAITPAIEAARAIAEAHEALPEAGFLEHYRPLYENATSAARLEEIESDAADDARNARLARNKYEQLQAAVGEWIIPVAVTTPLGSGQLQAARVVMDDALAVVRAATEADRALPRAGLREEVRPQFEATQTGAEMALLKQEVEQRAQDATTVGNALSTLNLRVPDWEIPRVVLDPVDAGQFAEAVAAAKAAEAWVESAYQADRLLEQIDALERTRPDFENARSLEDLQQGADKAEKWQNAANTVSLAIEENAKPRDLLTSFGLWGVSVQPLIDEALAAVIEGDVESAIQKATEAISAIKDGSSAGSLRLAGIVFFGVAVLGVLGLWVMLRRQAGPSWARSTKPHWVEDEKKGGLFGRRSNRANDKGKGKGKGRK